MWTTSHEALASENHPISRGPVSEVIQTHSDPSLSVVFDEPINDDEGTYNRTNYGYRHRCYVNKGNLIKNLTDNSLLFLML